jgi:hypothetical protein
VDLNITLSGLLDDYSLVYTGSDDNPLVASKRTSTIMDIPKEAQLKASAKNEHMKEMSMKEDKGRGDKSHAIGGSQLKSPKENEKAVEVAVEEDICYGDKSPVCGGSQLSHESKKHEATMGFKPTKEVKIEEDVGYGDKLPDSCQAATDSILVGLTLSSLASVISSNHLVVLLFSASDFA